MDQIYYRFLVKCNGMSKSVAFAKKKLRYFKDQNESNMKTNFDYFQNTEMNVTN